MLGTARTAPCDNVQGFQAPLPSRRVTKIPKMSSLHFSWQSAVLQSGCESTTKYVLLVVGTYMNQHGDGAFPSYGTLSKAASLNRTTVIRHITAAAAAGWLKIRVRRTSDGERDSNHYAIAFPAEVVAENNHLVAQNNQGGGAKQLEVVAQSNPNTPVEHPKEHKTRASRVSSENGQTDEQAKRMKASDLIADGIDADLARDFLQHRKTKKAPLTERAYAGIKREAAKAGWNLTDALTKAIERNWVGFEAEWVAKAQAGQKNAATGPAGAQDGDWWESAQEVERAAADKGVKRKPGEEFYWFKCRVAKACKERLWMDLILADLLRTKSSHYARVYEYFNGTPPMEGI